MSVVAITDVQIQLRHGTAASWAAANPTLAEGELGVELDTGMSKYGDGGTPWNNLPYAGGGGVGTLTGAVDPNGLVNGVVGQLYSQVPGDGSSTLWTCLGGLLWV